MKPDHTADSAHGLSFNDQTFCKRQLLLDKELVDTDSVAFPEDGPEMAVADVKILGNFRGSCQTACVQAHMIYNLIQKVYVLPIPVHILQRAAYPAQ